MKFLIARVSNSYKSTQPCENAILENDEWIIELNSLEDLIELMETLGENLIIKPKFNNDINSILIYDDYIE